MDSFIHWLSQIDNKILWLLSPVYVWFVKLVFSKLKELHARNSEHTARLRVEALKQQLENPPTLLGSVAYLVCFLPIPFALAMVVGTLYLVPFRGVEAPLLDPETAQWLWARILFYVCLLMYVIFATLSYFGIEVAWRLRHGEARYVENYNAAIQKKIAKLKKKYPNLQ